MNTDQVTLEQIVALAVLLENNEGILTKSPKYIRQKYDFCMATTEPIWLAGIMDGANKAKYHAWRTRWTLST